MKLRTAFIILIVLLLLAAVLAWLINPWSTTGSGISALLPEEPEKVNKVHVYGKFDTLEFYRSDSLWMMEEETMNFDAVENLVYAASKLSMRSILPAGEVEEIDSPLELVFKNGNREEGRFFFVPSSSGYIVFMQGEEQYYGVELPGYEGLSLEKIFSGDADHYRKHLLADLLPSEIAIVRVQPWKGTAFTALQDSAYNVKVLLPEDGREVTSMTDEHKIRLLFSYFNTIRYDRVAGPGEVRQEQLPETPWASVEVTTFEGVRRKFDVYQWVKEEVEGQAPGEPDLFEALVVYNERPLLLVVKYYYLDLLVRGLEYYR